MYAHALQCSRGGAGQRTRCPRSATSAGSDATAGGHQASGTPKRFAPSRPCRRPPQHVLQTPGTTGVSARHQRPQPQVWQSQSQSAWNSISYCEVSGANNGASGSTRCGPHRAATERRVGRTHGNRQRPRCALAAHRRWGQSILRCRAMPEGLEANTSHPRTSAGGQCRQAALTH